MTIEGDLEEKSPDAVTNATSSSTIDYQNTGTHSPTKLFFESVSESKNKLDEHFKTTTGRL